MIKVKKYAVLCHRSNNNNEILQCHGAVEAKTATIEYFARIRIL